MSPIYKQQKSHITCNVSIKINLPQAKFRFLQQSKKCLPYRKLRLFKFHKRGGERERERGSDLGTRWGGFFSFTLILWIAQKLQSFPIILSSGVLHDLSNCYDLILRHSLQEQSFYLALHPPPLRRHYFLFSPFQSLSLTPPFTQLFNCLIFPQDLYLKSTTIVNNSIRHNNAPLKFHIIVSISYICTSEDHWHCNHT